MSRSIARQSSRANDVVRKYTSHLNRFEHDLDFPNTPRGLQESIHLLCIAMHDVYRLKQVQSGWVYALFQNVTENHPERGKQHALFLLDILSSPMAFPSPVDRIIFGRGLSIRFLSLARLGCGLHNWPECTILAIKQRS